MKWSNKSFRKWLRILHRDLGYLMVGLSLIYGISGYILNHMDGSDPAFTNFEGSLTLSANLSREELITAWSNTDELPEIRNVLKLNDDHYRVMLDGGIGVYNCNTGHIDYESHSKKPLVYFINKLHYNKVKYWTIIGDIFAFTLIFFAVSGLFMVKGKKGFSGRGKWYLLAGIAIPIIFLIWL